MIRSDFIFHLFHLLGGKHSSECTLILTEGDSAKSLAVSGLGVIGRDRYGVFPLRGKILNVREATHKQVWDRISVKFLPQICVSVVTTTFPMWKSCCTKCCLQTLQRWVMLEWVSQGFKWHYRMSAEKEARGSLCCSSVPLIANS